MTSSAENKRSGRPPNPSIGESWPMKVSATSSRVPIWHTCSQDKVCLSPCSLVTPGEVLSDQLIRWCCIDRLSRQRLSGNGNHERVYSWQICCRGGSRSL